MTRPSRVLELVRAGGVGDACEGTGRCTMPPLSRDRSMTASGEECRRVPGVMLVDAGLVIRHTTSVPRPTTPRWATRLSPAGHERNPTPLGGSSTCCDCRLRCRTATPSRRPTSSTRWIADGQGDARRPAPDPRPPLPARRGHPAGPTPGGDSFKLARFAADNDQATDIVFCGVHFMAESADVLTGDHQRVILPDLNAGCSMADMADIDQVEECLGRARRRHRHRPGRARSPT